MALINIFVLFVYAVSYFLSLKFGNDWIKILPGLLLLYYLPGHNINTLLLGRDRTVSWFTRLALDLLSSISIISITFLMFQKYVKFQGPHLVELVLLINSCLMVGALFYDQSKFKLPNVRKFILENKSLLIIMLIPVLLFAIRLALNPYIYDIDSLLYFDAFTSIINSGVDATEIFVGREAFPYLMTGSYYVAGLGYVGFFKVVTPLIFYLSTGIIFELIKPQLKSKKERLLVYLLVFSSPMLVVMNEEVRPETFAITFSIPLLVLTYLSIKQNKMLYALMALFYSLVVFKFHEFGSILFLATVIAPIIIIIRNYKQIYQFVIENYKLIIIVAAPYLLLMKIYSGFLAYLPSGGLVSQTLIFIQDGLSTLKWDWWFLNDATTIWGSKIGWSGFGALYYYLYHGIIPLLMMLLAVIGCLVIGKKYQKIELLALVPTLLFFFIHFSIAEILPRLGIVLMFDRSWPHISLAAVVITVVALSTLAQYNSQQKLPRVLIVAVFLSVAAGIVGATVGTTYMGGMVLRQESKAIQTLKNIPENSLVISTQRNNNLVKIYGKKDFLQIKQSDYKQDDFERQVMSAIDEYVAIGRKRTLNSVVISKTLKSEISVNDLVHENIQESYNIADYDEKLALLKKYAPNQYAQTRDQLDQYAAIPTRPIYFIYSFAKLDHGILNTRGWWRESNDANNYNFFEDYVGQTITKDKNYILIKIN